MEELKPATSYSLTTKEDMTTSTVVDYIPGTRLLVDENATHLVYLPRPSASPDDPLNWSWVRKYTSMLLVCFWVVLLGGATISPAVTYGPLIQEMGVTVNYLNIAAAVALLLLGLGNLVFNPIVSAPWVPPGEKTSSTANLNVGAPIRTASGVPGIGYHQYGSEHFGGEFEVQGRLHGGSHRSGLWSGAL
jgi:hypothetical protein